MSKAEDIAKAIYIRCFDDEFKYPDVLNALRICAEENAETIEQLQNEIKQNEDLATIAYMQGASKKQKQAAEIIGGLLEIVDGLGNYSGGVFDRAREFVEAAK